MNENGEKKKVKQAIALEYNPAEDAPKVVASGRGLLAEKMIERAKESDVPIHRDDQYDQAGGYAFQIGNRRDDTAGVVRGCGRNPDFCGFHG